MPVMLNGSDVDKLALQIPINSFIECEKLLITQVVCFIRIIFLGDRH